MIIKYVCFFVAGALVIFISTSYSNNARKKYVILKKTDGKKHYYIVVIFLLFFIGYGIDYYLKVQALPKPINTFCYYFPDYFESIDHLKEEEFNMTPNALQEELNPNARCPCGSGKKYAECHNPELKPGENNFWRGPRFPRNYYFGYKEPINGIEFKKKEKAEIILLKGDNKIPLCRYFSMNSSILNNKAIVRRLSVEQQEDNLIFSGSLEIESESEEEVQFLIGTPNMESVNHFVTTNSSYENGRWLAFIGLGDNPLSSDVASRWFRYFATDGYKITLMPNQQISFEMVTKLSVSNIFTLSLPFNDIELVSPKITTTSSDFEISLELERENISWDIVIANNIFIEKAKNQNDSLLFAAELLQNDAGNDYAVRKPIKGPRKIRILLLEEK